MSAIPTHDPRLLPGPLYELAWREFWRHPKAGNGTEGPMRLFFLNRFPALAYLAAMILLVVGTWVILGTREATDRQYERELSNPFIWWVSVTKVPAAPVDAAGGSLVPERFWLEDVPYQRYGLHLVPKGERWARNVSGRSFQHDDPVLEQAAQNLVWPSDRETFLSAAREPGRFGVVVSQFLYEEILGYSDYPEFPRVIHDWSQSTPAVSIPVLGVVEYLPDGEFLISEEFVESFVTRTWRDQLFPRQTWVWSEDGHGEDAVEAMGERLSAELAALAVPYESLELTGRRGKPALFVRFPKDGVARADVLEALYRSDLLGPTWSHETGTARTVKVDDGIRYDRVAYVVRQDLDLVTEMVQHCRKEGLEVDASILLRARALVRGREHFLSQSRMVLVLNWAAALGLLVTVMMYKTHQGIHNFGVYLAIGGRKADGYRMVALQFFMIFAALVALVTVASLGMQVLGAQVGFYAFLPWQPGYAVAMLGMTAVAFTVVVLIRMYLHRRLWPSQMILYRE